MLDKLKSRAHTLKRDTLVLGLAFRDPRTPWYAKALIFLVIAYALSPIDLIPDFVPLLGYLDDLILVPAGIALSLRMIPPEVMAEARENAHQTEGPMGGAGVIGAAIVASIWIVVLGVIVLWLWRLFSE